MTGVSNVSSDQMTTITRTLPVSRSYWRTGILPGWFAPLFFLLLAALFLWRSTFAGEIFLPANLLGHVAPWSAVIKSDPLPPWNALRWDGIAQFYPWRHFAHDTLRSGTLPLWNPYQFCGTPFVANSQSAVFYPGNVLFYLLPTDRAFGAGALLHLTLCGWFSYLLLRRLGCQELSALLGGVVYTFSAWQVNWLQLPTFLATSCWFPLLLNQIYALSTVTTNKSSKGSRDSKGFAGFLSPFIFLALSVGMMLLAGHLQIAFYGLLMGGVWTICLCIVRAHRIGVPSAFRFVGLCLAGLCLGGMLALPQVLPTLELSKISHRQGKPSLEGFQAYVEYALPAGSLIMLALPEFSGIDSDAGNPYYGFYVKHTPGAQAFAIRHNAAETAVYVGIVPLFLAALALTLQFTRRRTPGGLNRRVLFFAGLALLALLLALGTPLNLLFYFLIPGFSQSGSPARCLVLWAFALSALSAFGLDALLRHQPTRRESGIAFCSVLFLFVIGLGLASQALHADIYFPPELKIPVIGEVFGRIGGGWIRLLTLLTGGACLLFAPWQYKFRAGSADYSGTAPVPVPAAFLALGLVVVDLFLTGINLSQTAAPEAVYPVTAGIRYLQEHSGHERIVPINKFWRLTGPPPAVFPPNAATVYGLRDAQGYDSLLTGQYKRFADTLARLPSPYPDGSLNSSPVEVGNIIFIQDPLNPRLVDLGAAFALTLSPSDPRFTRYSVALPENTVYNEANEMAIYPLFPAKPRAHLQRENDSRTLTPVVYRQDDPTRVTLEVNSPAPASLVLADQFYPGWRAQLDGKAVPITASSDGGVFRAVSVPPGTHTVAYRYEPASFRLGLYLACLAIATLAALLTVLFSLRSSHLSPDPALK